jgi:hypothetical protein
MSVMYWSYEVVCLAHGRLFKLKASPNDLILVDKAKVGKSGSSTLTAGVIFAPSMMLTLMFG